MGDLIELIFSNFLIFAAIIGGIISWFSGMNKENDQKQKTGRKTIPVPSSHPSGPAKDFQDKGMNSKSGEERLKDYYESKQQKLAEAKTSQTVEIQHDDSDTYMSAPVSSDKKPESASMLYEEGPIIEKTTKWNKKRLAEGVLMAEVLGPPRSRKPHSSHPRKR